MSVNDSGERQVIRRPMAQAESWPRVAIIVLNWNKWRDTIRCLQSLQHITYPDYQLIVVDNGSTDGSIDRIRAWAAGRAHRESEHLHLCSLRSMLVVAYSGDDALPGNHPSEEEALEQVAPARRLVMIVNRSNLGFAAGNNVAIRYALEKQFAYINLMNNDVVVEPSYLTTLVKSLGPGSRWSGAGPKILYDGSKNTIWYGGGRLKLWRAAAGHVGYRQSDGPSWRGIHDTGYVSGCCFLIKSELFASVGLLDEDYFFGGEDIDYSLRVWRKGFRLATNLDARVYHAAHLGHRDEEPMRAYYFNKYRLLLLRKQGTRCQQLLGFLVFVLTRLPKFARLSVQRRWDILNHELQSLRDFLYGRYGTYDRLRASRTGKAVGCASRERTAGNGQ